MAEEVDGLAQALSDHDRTTREYVRVEQSIREGLPPARRRRGRTTLLAVLAALVLAMPAAVFVGRAHFVPAASGPMDCPNAAYTPGGSDGFGGCYPYAGSTGIPAGTSLTAYTGSCTVTANDTVITAKTIDCDPLTINAGNVQISNSKINGSVWLDSPANPAYSFTITDSEVDVGPITPGEEDSGIGEANFVATRVHVYNGRRSVWCEADCTIQDSWLHGQAADLAEGMAHISAIRQGDGSNIIHNSFVCDAPDTPPASACSADLTGYGDFAPIQNNYIYRNLITASTGGYCAYGGSTGDNGSKPYGADAQNIRFIDNIFQRGSNNKCGSYGPIVDFDSTRPNNVWSNNKWDDGVTLPPDG